MELEKYTKLLQNDNYILADIMEHKQYADKAYKIMNLIQELIEEINGQNTRQKPQKEDVTQELNIANTLVMYGILTDKQLKSGRKKALLNTCQKEYERIGKDNYFKCLLRVSELHTQGKVKNIEAYFITALKREDSKNGIDPIS